MDEQFGEALKRIRDENGLSQKDLAAMAQVDPNTISNYERGKTKPRYDVLLRLSAALNTDLYEFGR